LLGHLIGQTRTAGDGGEVLSHGVVIQRNKSKDSRSGFSLLKAW
jgi:hypothetical protein